MAIDTRPITREIIPEKEHLLEDATEALAERDPWYDVAVSGLVQSNPISSGIRYQSHIEFEDDPNYNPFTDDVEKLRGRRVKAFRDSRSAAQTDDIIRKMELEKEDQAIAARHPWATGGSAVVGAVGNPLLWPGMFMAPGSIAAGMMIEIAGEGISEVILHSQQSDRTKMESLITVGTAVTMTGVFGHLAKRMNPGEFNKMTDAAEDVAKGDSAGGMGGSVGAAKTRDTTLDQETFVGGIANKLSSIGVAGRLLYKSPSKAARKLMQSIADTGYRFKKNLEGIENVVPAQTAALRADADVVTVERVFDEQHFMYRKDGGKLSKDDFATEVSRALENMDTHKIPEVQKTAETIRPYYSGTFEEGVNLQLYGKGAQEKYNKAVQKALDEGKARPSPNEVLGNKGEISYSPRIFNRKALSDDPKVRGAVHALFKSKLVKLLTRADENQKSVLYRWPDEDGRRVYSEVFLDEEDEFLKQFETGGQMDMFDTKVVPERIDPVSRDPLGIEGQADEIAKDIIHNMSGGSPISEADLDYITPRASAMKERTLNFVTNAELRATGVLIDDARAVFRNQHRQMVRDIEWYKSTGSKGLDFTEMELEYKELVESGKMTQQKAMESFAKDKDSLEIVRQRYMGIRGLPADPMALGVRLTEYTALFNSITLLAASIIPNIADIFAPVLRHGFIATARGTLTTLRGGFKISQIEAQRFGLAAEGVFGRRFAAQNNSAMGGIPLWKWKGKDVTTRDVGRASQKIFGLNWISDIAQTNATMIALQQINKRIFKYGNKPKDMAKLAEIGIGRQHVEGLQAMLKKHGTTEHGMEMANVHLWDDGMGLDRIYENAIRRDVLRATNFDDIGDRPDLFDEPAYGGLAKLVGQFQSFNAMATQKFLVAGMQRMDAEFLSGVATMTVIGGLLNYPRQVARGKDMSEHDVMDFLVDGMDRGGAFGFAGIAMAAGYTVAMDKPTSRFVMDSPRSMFLGPGFGPVWDTAQTAYTVATGQADTDDLWNLARRVPMANIFHIGDLTRYLIEGPEYRSKK